MADTVRTLERLFSSAIDTFRTWSAGLSECTENRGHAGVYIPHPEHPSRSCMMTRESDRRALRRQQQRGSMQRDFCRRRSNVFVYQSLPRTVEGKLVSIPPTHVRIKYKHMPADDTPGALSTARICMCTTDSVYWLVRAVCCCTAAVVHVPARSKAPRTFILTGRSISRMVLSCSLYWVPPAFCTGLRSTLLPVTPLDCAVGSVG